MKRLNYLFNAAILSLSLISSPVLAKTAQYEIDPSHSSVTFKIRHLVSKVNGSFDSFNGKLKYDKENPKNWSVDANIDTASINTNHKKRDDHLRSSDFFDAKKNPTIQFKSKQILTVGKDKAQIHGDLTLNGVTKQVVLDTEIHGEATDPWGNQRLGATARTKIDRRDFGMAWNKTLAAGGVLLGNEVEVTFEIEAIAKK